MSLRLRLGILLLPILFLSCATYKTYDRNHDQQDSYSSIASDSIKYSVYLIGDAGGAEDTINTYNNLVTLQRQIKASGEESSVVFLGDNIYPRGLPSKNHPERALAEARLDLQMNALKGYEGDIIFIAGNHDWYGDGLKSLKRQENYIESNLPQKNEFIPDAGCGDPYVKKLTDDMVLIAIDSQWWLEDWDDSPNINLGCEIRTREQFKKSLAAIMRKYRDQYIVFTMHHPMESFGNHGGRFSFMQQNFMLTQVNKKLLLPTPGLGHLLTFIRKNSGIPQDILSPKYQELKNAIIKASDGHKNVIFASGHEHNLQYIKNGLHPYIVSGSGTKNTPVARNKELEFKASKNGFAKFSLLHSGKTIIEYYLSGQDAPVYQENVGLSLSITDTIPRHDCLITASDSARAKITDYETKEKSKLYNTIWGKHYREHYGDSITVPILNLKEYNGGLTISKRGGGNQTNSLRLEDSKGHQYSLRSVEKDPSRLLPSNFTASSIIKYIVRDQFTGSYPLAPLGVSLMMDSLDITHPSPKVFFVPCQEALGKYSELFGNNLYTLEERPEAKWSDTKIFEGSDDIISTLDVYEQLERSQKNTINERVFLKNRLFDLVIGDWDRHQDQWRWIEKNDTMTPIPRDRDQAFSHYDGLLPGLIRKLVPITYSLRKFEPNLDNPNKTTYTSSQVDNAFLTSMEWEKDWLKEIDFIQKHLTDDVIDRSIDNLPRTPHTHNVDHIKRTLKARRDDLLKGAREYFLYINREVSIIGTEKIDSFHVQYLPEGLVRVESFQLSKKRKIKHSRTDRVFYPDETKEIHLYGLSNDDVYKIEGQEKSSIKIRCLGGDDKDIYINDAKKKVIVHDYKSKDQSVCLPNIKRRLSNSYYKNNYINELNKTPQLYNLAFPGYNIDDGFTITTISKWQSHRFKKDPFAIDHNLRIRYSTNENQVSVAYNNTIKNVFKSIDWKNELSYSAPTEFLQFYGIGGDTPGDEDLDFYSAFFESYSVSSLLNYSLNKKSFFSAGPTFSNIRFATNGADNRFLTTDLIELQEFDEFEYFVGGRAEFNFNNTYKRNRWMQQGINLSIKHKWEYSISDKEQVHNFEPYLALYYPLFQSNKIYLAHKLGVAFTSGDPEFYQLNILGSGTNFRGVSRERFFNRNITFANTDIRISLLQNRKFIPFRVGVTLGGDLGRAYSNGEERIWHYSYGSELWISPLDAININIGYFTSDTDNRFSIRIGHFF